MPDILGGVIALALPALALLLAMPGVPDAPPAATTPSNAQSKSRPASPKGRSQGKSTPVGASAAPPLCEGDYADSLPPEIASRAADDDGRPGFVFAIRSIATYEHIYYGHDGKLRKQYLRSVVHGTGFAWKVINGETYFVTNEHVASRPDVTDDDHPVEGVPPGSKKVREQLKIVKDESDDYEPGHVALTKVLSDPGADIAVLKTKKLLPLMPFRLGRSSALRAGNVVQVRGFPLGVFTALSSGKVVNPYAPDSEKGWAHVDFVIDALLSSGNSGSPVFAVSCRTQEPELVGIFHAGYTDAAALNVVVGIDQLKEELETFRVPKREAGVRNEISAADRDRMVHTLFLDPSHAQTIPFAGRAVRVSLVNPETIRFSLLTEDFPLSVQESLAVVDRAASGFGSLDEVGLSKDDTVVDVPASALDEDARDHFQKLQDSLWQQLVAVVDYRLLAAKMHSSADAFSSAQGIAARIKRRVNDQKDLLGLCAYDADQAGVPAAKPLVPPADGGPPPALLPAPLAPPGNNAANTSTGAPAKSGQSTTPASAPAAPASPANAGAPASGADGGAVPAAQGGADGGTMTATEPAGGGGAPPSGAASDRSAGAASELSAGPASDL